MTTLITEKLFLILYTKWGLVEFILVSLGGRNFLQKYDYLRHFFTLISVILDFIA